MNDLVVSLPFAAKLQSRPVVCDLYWQVLTFLSPGALQAII
jgi:hypothetical protein